MTCFVSINRDALDKGESRVVLVELPSGTLRTAERVRLQGNVTLGMFDPPRPYGARVGLTCDAVEALA